MRAQGEGTGGWRGIEVHRALVVRRVRQLNSITKAFELDGSISAEPGQFAMVWLPGLDEKPFSLMSDDPLSFAVAAVGPFSRVMHGLGPGDRLWVRGPYGNGFKPEGHRHVLVGGGYGAAPLLFLARELVGAGHRVRVALGARTSSELLLADEISGAASEVAVATEDGSAGEPGLVTDVLAPMLESEQPHAVYACGPHGMLHAVARLCADREIAAQLSWEAYMRCGIGLCGSCEHEGRLVCADGPVLDARPDGAALVPS